MPDFPHDHAFAQATDLLGPWFQRLAEMLPTGVLVTKHDGTPVYANTAAQRLLESQEVARSVESLARRLPELPEVPGGLPSTHQLDLELPTAPRRLVLRSVRVEDGFLILMEDPARQAHLDGSTAMAGLEQSRRLWRSHVHDLKSPLNAVSINLQLLQDSLDQEGNKQQIATARILRQEVARLTRFLDSFVRQALRTEPEEPGRQRCDLRPLVRNAARVARPKARHARIRVRSKVPTRPVFVDTDVDWLQQALLHLLLNSIEAQPRGGEIRLILAPTAGWAHILVDDDGPGIPESLRERACEMGFTTKQDARGIGLPVARSLVEALGGRLSLESGQGGGTTVRIELPSKDE